MSTNELIELTANGIEEDILGLSGLDAIPVDLSIKIQSRLYDYNREFAARASREITSRLGPLVVQAIE